MATIVDAQATTSMAIDLSKPNAEADRYMYDAEGLAAQHQLDYLDLLGDDGTIISSREWRAHFGYKMDWVAARGLEWNRDGAFLCRTELADGAALSLTAVRVLPVGEKKLFVVGGLRLDKGFLSSLVLPEGMRALIYTNLQPSFDAASLTDVNGPVPQADRLAGLIEEVRKQGKAPELSVQWNPRDPASTEGFDADSVARSRQ